MYQLFVSPNLAFKRDNKLHNVGSKLSRTEDVTASARYGSQSETFHRAMSPILVTAQIFGILPLEGVWSSSACSLKFRLRSPRVIYSASLFLIIAVIEVISVIHMVKVMKESATGFMSGIGAATAGAVFYGNACVAMILFFKLSARWPGLMISWSNMEKTLRRPQEPNLKFKFRSLTAIIMLPALAEHVLSILINVPEILRPHQGHGPVCPGDGPGANETSNFLRIYCCHSHRFIFDTIEYNVFAGIVIFFCSKMATFTWNFADLFVSLMSIGVAERFKQINNRINAVNMKSIKKEEWQELREHFALISSLIKEVDKNISGIILLSFGNNLYFICLQLLNGLTPNLSSALDSVYFFGSFFFLLARTVIVTLMAARVHDQSKTALPTLFNCPTDSFCEEARRLQVQMTTDEIAFTGLKFFSITRNFMLAVAGAIITYEIVLLQFNVAMLNNNSNK